jgi:hypothetical protein
LRPVDAGRHCRSTTDAAVSAAALIDLAPHVT